MSYRVIVECVLTQAQLSVDVENKYKKRLAVSNKLSFEIIHYAQKYLTIIRLMTTTIDIDITDIIQNNPLLDEEILPDIIKKFQVLVPNTDEFEPFDPSKIIRRQTINNESSTINIQSNNHNNQTIILPDITTQPSSYHNLLITTDLNGTSDCVTSKRNLQSSPHQPLKRKRYTHLINTPDDPVTLGYDLRDRSKLIQTSDDYMTYYESTDDEDDLNECPDYALLSNTKLLEFLICKDKYNITDEAIRIFNQLESIYGCCPSLYHLRKLRATLNKNIPIQKCAYLHVNDAIKLLVHSDPSVIENASNEVLHIKHNMDGTTIGASTNFLMSTITCMQSGANKQSVANVIPLGQFKFDKENRTEIDRVLPDEFVNMMEKKLIYLKNLKLELDFQMSIDMKMMWQVMGQYGIS
ncbi:unnamed protein product, partial [Didymodactylos carnosus]